jgi:hypothetical protein
MQVENSRREVVNILGSMHQSTLVVPRSKIKPTRNWGSSIINNQ